jgi:hypothetical protein|tara:strand:+ start:8881 stop:9297 length:417 start_codon:yes stop_codon:yes gene_type:complete
MKKFKGDRRTKQGKTDYEQWKKNHSEASKGLGDVVEKVTEATGIKKFVKFVAGNDCGCDQRKDMLNYLFPKHKPNCLTENEYNYLSQKINLKTIKGEEQKALLKIYNRVFNENRPLTGCDNCFFSGVMKKLQRLFREY